MTIEKENTKQSNANSISQCVVSIGNVWVSVMYSKESRQEKKLRRNIIGSAVIKDRNCRVD